MATAPRSEAAACGLLAGLSVLELGDGIAGSSAAAQLAALGASVQKLVGRRRAVIEHEPRLAGNGSFVAALLDRDKTVEVGADPVTVARLAAISTIVIDDRFDGIPDPGVHVDQVRACNRSVWVTISPFGLDGPRAADPGGELVASASGGLLATVTDEAGAVPVALPGFVASRVVGHVAALAALHGLDRRQHSGAEVHVDVSAQEAVAMVGALPECAHVLYRCPGRAGSGRYVAPSGAFRCRDGFVRIAAIENHQWAAMVRVLGAPDWTKGLEDRAARAEHAAFITAKVEEWARDLEKDACAEILQREGVPSTPVNGPDEILASAQFRHREFIVDAMLGDTAVRVPGSPWVLDLDAFPSAPELESLSALRVLEFTHVLAAPIAGALIGAMGADVVRLEETDRLDLYRRTGPFADGEPGVERGAYFAVANHSKRSVVADARDAPTAAQCLVEGAHVVLENVGLRRLEKLGATPSEIRARSPRTLVASLSGFGNDGPLAGYRVYANNVQAYGGLAYLTRDGRGELARVGTVLADVLSSVVSATVVAAWWLGPMRDGGGTLDVSMSEVVASILAEFVAEASAGTVRTVPFGCELAPRAPHGVYRAADGRWLALSVQSDDEWGRLVAALELSVPARWESARVRWAERADLDDVVARTVADRDPDELRSVLRAASIRAAEVLDGATLVVDPHLRARGFFPAIEHPDAALPDARVVGLGWRFAGEGPIPLAPPPALGSAPLDLDDCERTWIR